MGSKFSITIVLIKRLAIESIIKTPYVSTLIDANKDVFLNQGCFPEVLKLKLQEGTMPKSSPASRCSGKDL